MRPDRRTRPDITPLSKFPDLEKPGVHALMQLLKHALMTTRGDIIFRGADYVQRLAAGTEGQVPHYDANGEPVPGDIGDISGVLPATSVEVEELGNATYDDVQDYMNFFGDRTLLTGGAISSNGDGSATVASGTAWTKATDSETAIGLFFNFSADASVSLTDMAVNFIYVDYNGGTPQIVVANDAITHGFKLDHVIVGALFRDGTTLHIKQTVNIGIGRINKVHMHHIEESVAHRASGVLTSVTGTRQLVVTSGVLYAGLSRQTTSAFDTSGADTFSYWYTPDSGSSWTEVTGQTAIDNTQYNDITSGLSALTGASKRGVHWVYIDLDGNDLHVVYGQDNYSTAEAELAAVPAVLPPLVVNYCLLIAKIIVQKDQNTLFISYPWTSAFLTSLVTDHGALAGLTDDDHAQYVKDTEFTASEDILVGTGSGTFAKKTPAELLAILSGEAGTAFSWNDKVLTALKGLLLTAATELTIDGSGVITVTQMVHTVDTAGDAASDNLDTINGGTTVGLIIIRPAHTDRTVVVRTGQGNIVLQGGADISLDDITDHMWLFWDTTNSKWVDLGGGGAAGASTALDNLASVAINESLISDTNDTDDLGSDAKAWKDIHYDGALTKAGVEGRIFVELSPTPRVFYRQGQSEGPLTATVSSVSGDTITLTAAVAAKLFDETQMGGNVYLQIVNTSRSNETAWVKAQPAANQLQVVTAGDIAAWVNGNTISDGIVGQTTNALIDVSPSIPEGATGVFIKLFAQDSGTITAAKGAYAYKGDGQGGQTTYYQVSGFYIASYPFIPLDGSLRQMRARNRATGVNTGAMQIILIAYVI